MGFMGLASTHEVDGASDLKYSILNSIQERFKEELDDEGNKYNPPGFINILLVLKEEPALAHYLSHSMVARINYEIAHFPENCYGPECEVEFKSLVETFNKNPTIKKVLRTL